ncbi:MAG: sigma-70 family RNA polymerase sigma factor [Phycisphaerales bacterium]|nr:MAG: sigma-70 family RNA polymerase sigma factor [Phycisphaerales bacterium]
MLEDRLLVWKFKRGGRDAFCRIYEKYRDDLLRLAISLLTESDAAEDVVHDVFAAFIRDSRRFRLTGSLKGYLATCVANRARNVNRTYQLRHGSGPEKAPAIASRQNRPDRWIIHSDELRRLNKTLAKLPYDQRETVIMRAQLGMKFRQIAKSQNVSSKTAQSRYRIGLDKLRSLLNGEATK